ncbi:MAG: ABC transporter substrate-binding protein [Bifidobacteriaceae bacterium]|jgi:iron complex transport system substrate-binding protein|nr:ABC transporter substrate-binding protein [Bifidobacteriaceae bacterium]
MTKPPAARGAATLLAALLAAATLTSCSGGSADPDESGEAGVSQYTGWTYTDDAGVTVDLDQRPTRIAAFTDYAIGLFSYGIEPVAIFGREDVATDRRLKDYDLSDVAIVGNNYGEIDLEALAAAQPDLIVTGIYPTDRDGTLSLEDPYYALADKEQQEQLAKIAPIVVIKVGGAGIDVIESLNALAVSLGASADAINQAKAAYDAAAAELTEAAAQSDLELTMIYGGADGIYLVKPMDEPTTELYTSLGVKFTDLAPDGDYYWDIYSWENAAQTMTGDVLLVFTEGYQEADLLAQPTFASHPALAAGQVYTWADAAFDYDSQAAQFEYLTTILRDSEKVA